MRLAVVEAADGELALYANDQLVVETDDGLIIEIAEKMRDLEVIDEYHYVHRPDYDIGDGDWPPYLIDIFMRDLET